MSGQAQSFTQPDMSQASPEAVEAFRELLKAMLKIAFSKTGNFKSWHKKVKKLGLSSLDPEQPDVRIQSDCWGSHSSMVRLNQLQGLKAGYRGVF